MAIYKNIVINQKFLDENPDVYFIFGDNLIHTGYGGAAILRDHPRAIGFITKKYPDNHDSSFYKPYEYEPIFNEELEKLKLKIQKNPNKTFYISQLGSGLANRYKIWDYVIKEKLIRSLEQFNNVVFCWI